MCVCVEKAPFERNLDAHLKAEPALILCASKRRLTTSLATCPSSERIILKWKGVEKARSNVVCDVSIFYPIRLNCACRFERIFASHTTYSFSWFDIRTQGCFGLLWREVALRWANFGVPTDEFLRISAIIFECHGHSLQRIHNEKIAEVLGALRGAGLLTTIWMQYRNL